MTDLSRVPAATISPLASVEEANQSMILRGVRLLLVVSESSRIVGVITSTDTLGEKPMVTAQSRSVRRSDLTVADIMVPVSNVEAMSIEDVRRSSVGDIALTLQNAGRAHALVVSANAQGALSLVGIFSVSQIARQLGIPIQTHERARTFAEVEALIASA
ncbi:CBS domain-containing protein [Uliginosibacterium sp. H3]|uniref:CBS domain-containing protein n=1 Tax=Uliginosibacterium silvisoli TaxID=3114758 RepID=A0ABU6JZ24_9RHOO|nr:CBS domain-containing protein [Uliginosibacterium sp. H3]